MSYSGIARIATSLVTLSRSMSTNPTPEKQGGYLMQICGFTIPNFEQVGKVSDPKELGAYGRFAPEKAFRLYSDWLRDPENTVSSWQTRDEQTQKYGGAVVFLRRKEGSVVPEIISYSGLNEHIDESIVLTLGHHLGILSKDRLKRVIAISNNKSFDEMLALAIKCKII